jgi:hypothetical protein
VATEDLAMTRFSWCVLLVAGSLAPACVGQLSSGTPPIPEVDGGVVPGTDSGPDPVADGGVVPGPDAGEPGPDAGPGPTGCRVVSNDRVGIGEVGEVAVAARSTDFAVLWTERRAGVSAIYGARFGEGETREVVLAGDEAGLPLGAAIAADDAGYVGAYYANASGGFEIYVRRLPFETSAPAVRITNDSDRDDAPLLRTTPSGFLVGWSSDESGAVFRVAALDAALARVGEESMVIGPPHTPSDVHLGDLGLYSSASFNDSGSGFAVRVGAGGEPEGELVEVSLEDNVTGRVAMAATSEQAAAAFGVVTGGSARAIRVRTFTRELVPFGSERVITGPHEVASDPELVSLAAGYAIVYRASADDDLSAPATRLRFVLPTGEPVGRLELGPASDAGARPRIAISTDGTMIAAWGGADGGVEVVRARCD